MSRCDAANCIGHFCGRLKAILRLFGNRLVHDVAHGWRDIRAQLMDGDGILAGVLIDRGDGVVRAKRHFARQHLIHHNAQRIDVAPAIHRQALALLGRHIFRRADAADPGQGACAHPRLCDAKVGQHKSILFDPQNIAGFYIAMDDAFAMGKRQCLGHLARDQ